MGNRLGVERETLTLDRPDGKTFKVKTYSPKKYPLGLVVISPGAGGSENGLGYLAEYFSRHGWLVCVMEHLESNLAALKMHIREEEGLKKGLVEMVTDPSAYQGRMMEIQQVLTWAIGSTEGPKILAGHSMGAATVMMEAGATNKLDCHGADRFDAYIALSPQGPGMIFQEGAWEHLRKPMLLITGTKDQGIEGNLEWRLKTFENMTPGTQKLLGVIDGANHMNLCGRGFSGGTQECVFELVDLFLQKIMGKAEVKIRLSKKIDLTMK